MISNTIENTAQEIFEKSENNFVCLVGKNGSGKTESLKRLRDCLYGQITNDDKVIFFDIPNAQIILNSDFRVGRYAFEKILNDFLKLLNDEKLLNIDEVNQWFNDNNITTVINEKIKRFSSNAYVSHQIDIETQKHIIFNKNFHVDESEFEKMLNDSYKLSDDEKSLDFNKISQWLNDNNIITSIDSNTKKIDINLCMSQIDTKEKQINFYLKIGDSKEKRILRKSPSGFRTLVPLLFNIELIKCIIGKNKNSNFFVLIDEPETNLHPEWQIQLQNYFIESVKDSNGHLRLIYATHSPYLINTSKLDSVKLIEYKNNGININSVFDYTNDNTRELSLLKPIEDALGFKFDIFSTPFVTVEGEQEMELFKFLLNKPEHSFFPKMINIQGSAKLSPYLLLAHQHKIHNNLESVFIIDADVDIRKECHGLEDKEKIVDVLKEHFIFVGKELYTFDTIYENNVFQNKNECLEDYLAEHIFGDYNTIKEIALDCLKQYGYCDNNWRNCIDGKFSHNYKNFKSIITCIKGNISISTQEYNRLSEEIKVLVLKKALEKITTGNLSKEFDEIINTIKIKLNV